MQCVNCGHDRPKRGKCPHCGAEAESQENQGKHFSSLRDWRDQSPDTGSGTPQSSNRTAWQDPRSQGYDPQTQTPSRPRGNPNNSNWGSESQTPSRPRGNPNNSNWGNASQTPSRPRGNPSSTSWGNASQTPSRPRGNPNQSYAQRDDLSLIQIPSAESIMAPIQERMLPALPTEEEEQALGIRRPSFIPATEERKGPRPSRWRVISGVLSLLILLLGVCGLGAYLIKTNVIPGVNNLLGFSKPNTSTRPLLSVPTVYTGAKTLVTPASAPNPAITTIITTNSVSKNTFGNLIIGNTQATFLNDETIYVVLRIEQKSKVGDNVTIRWFFNSSEVTQSLETLNPKCCAATLTTANPTYVYFQVNIPQVGFGYGWVWR